MSDQKISSMAISRRKWLGSASTVRGVRGDHWQRRLRRAQEYKLGGADIKLGVASYSFRKFDRDQGDSDVEGASYSVPECEGFPSEVG